MRSSTKDNVLRSQYDALKAGYGESGECDVGKASISTPRSGETVSVNVLSR